MPRRRGVPPRPHQRKPNGKRVDSIRAIMAQGQTDPATIAQLEGCSKELVIYYAKRMADVVVDTWKPSPQSRRRLRIGWKVA